MRSHDLKKLRPFVAQMAWLRKATSADFTSCTCTLEEGQWRMAATCKRSAKPCRTATAAGVRTTLAMMRLGTGHLDATELDQALADVHALTLDLPRVTIEDFELRMHQAFRVPIAPRPAEHPDTAP